MCWRRKRLPSYLACAAASFQTTCPATPARPKFTIHVYHETRKKTLWVSIIGLCAANSPLPTPPCSMLEARTGARPRPRAFRTTSRPPSGRAQACAPHSNRTHNTPANNTPANNTPANNTLLHSPPPHSPPPLLPSQPSRLPPQSPPSFPSTRQPTTRQPTTRQPTTRPIATPRTHALHVPALPRSKSKRNQPVHTRDQHQVYSPPPTTRITTPNSPTFHREQRRERPRDHTRRTAPISTPMSAYPQTAAPTRRHEPPQQ